LRGSLPISCALALCPVPGVAQTDPGAPAPARQALSEAWWTGPMLANSAATLPRGHALIETYVYDVHSARGDSLGSLTYMLYGVSDALTLGVKPSFGSNAVKGARDSSGIGVGDITLQGQYRLTAFDAARGMPALAISIQETLPTGRYDRLGARPADGMGGGAWGTTVALYAQHYFWLPNGRILRGRINLSETFSSKAPLHDVSVYGTSEGFRGTARPGRSFYLGGSLEYSVTKRWVLGLDATWTHNGRTRVSGLGAPDPATGIAPSVRLEYGASDAFALAPAIEYSWTPNLGVLLAARIIPRGHDVAPSVTPAIAINAVF
jgi:hypothetical protein